LKVIHKIITEDRERILKNVFLEKNALIIC